MALLPPVGWAEVATKSDLAAVEQRLLGEMAELRGEIAELRGEMKWDNARLLRTILLVNFMMMVGLSGLVFQIASAAG